MSQVILLSLTASLNSKLAAATTVMLLLDKPARLMTGHLLGLDLVMLWLLQVPLAWFLISPEWTPPAIDRARDLGHPARTPLPGPWIRRDRRAAGHQRSLRLSHLNTTPLKRLMRGAN